MYDNRPIGVFDSGVGGLSILASIKEVLPSESFIYLADQANNPYGAKKENEIRQIADKVVAFLISKNVKLLVVACNTATVHALDYLRSKYNLPIIGVVPVVKTISENTRSGNIAVFSTPATAESKYLKDLIKKFANGKKVYIVGDSKLEHLIEEGIINGREIENTLNNSLLPLIDKGVDAIALGCTHYPFVTTELKKLVGSKMSVYDSGGAVARRVTQVLENENLLAGNHANDVYYTTGDVIKFRQVAEKLLRKRLGNVKKGKI